MIEAIKLLVSDPMIIILAGCGVFLGIYVGVIPGLSGAMAVSLLVSLTYGWNVNWALGMIIGVYNGAAYGGSRSAILLNIPGAPGAVATSLDGYKLAGQGKAGEAMGIATIYSVIGGIIGTLAMIFFTPQISKIAIKFLAKDYILLIFMGLMLVGSLGSKSLAKSIVSACIGLMLGCVGIDSMTGYQRFTFGNAYLMAGVDSTVTILGLFGAAESIIQIRTCHMPAVKQSVSKIVPRIKDFGKHIALTVRSSIIGVIVGALPGTGGSIAALLAYDNAKRIVKSEVPFGEGAIEGVIAPETANNASVGGTLIPMLTLGIPGDSVSAILMGALMIHGLQPGPTLLSKTPQLFSVICIAMLISQLFLLVFGLTGIKITTKLLDIPKPRLMPMVIVLSVVGSYALNRNLYDILWMSSLGIIAYFMKLYDYPVAPAVLGVILSYMLEKNYLTVAIQAKAKGGFINTFILPILQSPISLILLAVIILSLSIQTKWFKRLMQRLGRKKAQTK